MVTNSGQARRSRPTLARLVPRRPLGSLHLLRSQRHSRARIGPTPRPAVPAAWSILADAEPVTTPPGDDPGPGDPAAGLGTTYRTRPVAISASGLTPSRSTRPGRAVREQR